MRTIATITTALLLAAGAVALTDGGAPRAAYAAAAPPALLQVVQNGRGSVRVEGRGQALECDQGFYSRVPCMYRSFSEGDTVTLTAIPFETANPADQAVFKGWSDRRCPAQPTCNLTLLDDQTVIALFSPQTLSVDVEGDKDADEDGDVEETVTITDGAGRTCTVNVDCQASEFPLFSSLTLVANGKLAQFNRDDCDTTQQSSERATCTLVLLGEQRVNVGFNGVTPEDTIPPRIDVVVRARKTGTGSGTIRGAMNCGNDCTARARFRERITLRADPDAGSRFVRWVGGCGTDPTCTLAAVGNVITAEFGRVGAAVPSPSGARPGYVARLVRVSTSGRGGRRQVVIKVRVNRRSSLVARLTKGGRHVAGTSFSVAAGAARTLRLRVPTKARPGLHKLTLTFRAGATTKQFTPNVRLRR